MSSTLDQQVLWIRSWLKKNQVAVLLRLLDARGLQDIESWSRADQRLLETLPDSVLIIDKAFYKVELTNLGLALYRSF